MITAKDVFNRLSTVLGFDDSQVEQWLIDVFIPQVISHRSASLYFQEEEISNYWIKNGKIYKRDSFIESLRKRNFTVTFKCDDRPCGGCYFTISCKE